jgi:hypothetical protein
MFLNFVYLIGYVCLYWLVAFSLVKLLRLLIGVERVDSFVARHQLHIALGQFRWQTTRFNHRLSVFGRKHRLASNLWFSVGAIVGIASLFGAVALLIYGIVQSMFRPSEQALLTPVVPGINVPNNHLFYCKIVLGIGCCLLC